MTRLVSLVALTILLPQTTAPPVTQGASPAVSPDGRWIALTSNRSGSEQVYVIAADGSNEHQVTHADRNATAPQWAADARTLRYLWSADGVTHVVQVDLAGQQEREMLAVEGRGPRLTPDGARVVYGAGPSWTEVQLMVAPVVAGAPRAPRMINDGTSVAWNATWSPDGRQIAFTGRVDDVLQVFIVNADGSGLRQITHHTKADGGAQVPAWSADSRWIAYQSNTADHRAWIWVVGADGTGAHRVMDHTAVYLDEFPSWFPDGRRLAFQSNRTGAMQIWTVNVDGTDPRQLTGM